MPPSGNGTKPSRSSQEVASELRQRLERRLGRERTDEIWQDPANVREVVQGEEEAAAVTEIMLNAWRDLPADEPSEPGRKRSGFRRGLRIALIMAIAVWSFNTVRRLREGNGEDV
ncbi:MAG: hypothetical protein IIC89_04655 [Chloroflexi bacterium]|nr:hypothetical protein [Chloroflexota bacterium]